MPNSGIVWELGARSQLLALEGVEGRAEVPRLDQEQGQLSCFTVLHPKPTTSWLKLILHPFGCWDKPRATWTHLTHHGPDSGEATTFPLIVFSAALRGGYIKWLFFPGLPRWSPETVPVWTPGTLGIHNFSPQAWIGTRFEPKLQFSSRAFHRHVVLPLQTLGRGRFLTFSGRDSKVPALLLPITWAANVQMAHARPFWTSKLQDLSNGIKNTSMRGVLTPELEL